MDNTPISLLLADDDRDDCDLFKDVLDELSLSTVLTTVNDGERLMHMLGKATTTLPDILFLDLNMPKKNGFECLEEINRNERLKALPVVIISTSFDSEIVKLLYVNGARHYICKPNEFGKLKRVVETAVSFTLKPGQMNHSFENFVLMA